MNNNGSAFEHKDFVKRSIADLVCTGVAKEVSTALFVVNPLSLWGNWTGKEKVIIDLRHVNKYQVISKFKYEGVKGDKTYAANTILNLSLI